MNSKYQSARNKRREMQTKTGRFRGGRLAPVMAVPVRGSESGLLSQVVTMELDPIAGRLITPITGELIAIFVPVQACDAIKNPQADYAGMTEVVRDKLLSGNPLFGLEAETEISRRCGVEPRKVNAVMRVNEITRLAHNCAVNFLRQRAYHKASLLTHSNASVTPAILSQSILERLNGVLDPDDRINGSVQLELPTLNLPVEGIGFDVVTGPAAQQNTVETNRTVTEPGFSVTSAASPTAGNAQLNVRAALDANGNALNHSGQLHRGAGQSRFQPSPTCP